MCLLLTAVTRTVTQLYTSDTVTCMCSKLMKNFGKSRGNLVHSNPSTNQLTEKKHSKRKTPYRPLERTEPLNRRAGWKTEAQSQKRSAQKKKEPSNVSMRTKNTMIMNKKLVEEGLRESHTKNQSEETGALQSAKKPPPKRTGQKKPKKQHSGEKGALEKDQLWKRTW